MAHSILRLRKLHAADIAPCGRHNFRRFQGEGEVVLEEGEEELYEGHTNTYIPQAYRYARKHIDFDKSKENEYIGYDRTLNRIEYVENFKMRLLPLQEQIALREKELNIKGIRKDSIHALEMVLTVSNCERFLESQNYSESGFMGIAIDFTNNYFSQLAKDKIDRQPVIAAAFHKDESNWHIHLIVQPTITQEYRSKNRYGETVKKETRLAIRKILGDHTWDKQPLRNMQTAWNEFLANKFNARQGEKIENICRVEDQQRPYIEQTNAALGSIARQMEELQEKIKQIEDSEQWKRMLEELENLKKQQEEIKEQYEKERYDEHKEIAQKETSLQAVKNRAEKRNDKEPETLTRERRKWGFRK